MFFGTYQHTLDTKGRIIIPSALRLELGANFIVMRGVDGCLFLYPGSEFEKFSQKFADLPKTDKNAQAYIRMFMSSMTRQDFDSQGRVLIPPPLRKYASLERDAVIIGAFDRVEIWDSKRWEEYSQETADNYDEILHSMTERGI